jgi:hypothetical protein
MVPGGFPIHLRRMFVKKLTLMALLAVVVLGLSPTMVMADFNVGASLTDTEAEDGGFDADDNNWKIFGGWRSSKREWFGIEAQYVDFGDFDDAGLSIEATSFDVFALAALKIWRFDLFGKAGVAFWDSDASGALGGDDSGTDFAYGVGAAFRIGDRLHIRAEWEVFELDGADLDMASIGIDLKF